MSPRATDLFAELIQLPEGDRGELAARLLESLDGGPDPDADAAWADEIKARLEDVRSGRVTPVPWDEARRQILADDGDAAG
jgi:putative addiction module component (TIGR02574 family)